MIHTENTVVVVGLGYIGLPTALLLANSGWRVIGVDSNIERVKSIQDGFLYIQEPELGAYFATLHNTSNFCVTTTLGAMTTAQYYIIAVPTPCRDNRADLTYVWQVVDVLVALLKKGDTLILESTVPIGTTQKISEYIYKKTCYNQDEIHVAYSPERVMPGKIVQELRSNNRVIGGVTRVAAQKALEIYSSFVLGELTCVTSQMAEAVKLVENSYRDVMLACTYQVASLAQKASLNEYELIELANKHPRVNLLRPTAGVGGHCIAVDPWFLIEAFPQETQLFKAAREINNQRPQEIIKRVMQEVAHWRRKNKKIPRILIAGITYKADSDDTRESPALYIAKELVQMLEKITICEPNLPLTAIQEQMPLCAVIGIEHVVNTNFDIVLFLVPHKSFFELSLEMQWHVLDFCGILHQKERDNHYETTLFREKRS